MRLALKRQTVCDLLIFLYFISISAYQLGTGFDALFVRLIFALLIGTVIMLSGLRIKKTEHFIWCVSFWLLYYASVLWGHNFSDTISYLNHTIQIVGFAAIFPLIIHSKKDVYKILKMLVTSLLYMTILLIIRTPTSAWGTERIGAVIGQSPNTIGIRLAIGSGISLFLFHEVITASTGKKRKLEALYYFSITCLFAVVTLLTGSKKGLFAVIFCIASYELLITKGIKFFFKVVISLVALVFLYNLMFSNEMLYGVLGRRVERMMLTLQGTATGFDIDKSLNERLFFQQQAKQLFFDYPILGYGGNNFRSYLASVGYGHATYCHNNFYEILSTLGIVGFALYYSLWGLTEYRLIKYYYIKRNRLKESDNVRLVLLFSIIIAASLIMDYGLVSYIEEFTQILLIIGCTIWKTVMEEENYEHG